MSNEPPFDIKNLPAVGTRVWVTSISADEDRLERLRIAMIEPALYMGPMGRPDYPHVLVKIKRDDRGVEWADYDHAVLTATFFMSEREAVASLLMQIGRLREELAALAKDFERLYNVRVVVTSS